MHGNQLHEEIQFSPEKKKEMKWRESSDTTEIENILIK